MASLKEVKNRLKSVNSTQQITKAMKMVAAGKLRKAQENIMQIRPYAQKINALMTNLAQDVEGNKTIEEYSEKRELKSALVVVISSDRGLCGAFNNATFKYAMTTIETKYSSLDSPPAITVMPIGKKSFDFFKRLKKYETVNDFATHLHEISFNTLKAVAEYVMDEYVKKTYDEVIIVYNEFKNVATQILRDEQFLPIKEQETDGNAEKSNTDYLYLPDRDIILSALIPKSLKIAFYKTILESYASEMGARMIAMDKATDNANELIKELKLTYNRTRQASITNEILEIVGGAEALENG